MKTEKKRSTLDLDLDLLHMKTEKKGPTLDLDQDLAPHKDLKHPTLDLDLDLVAYPTLDLDGHKKKKLKERLRPKLMHNSCTLFKKRKGIHKIICIIMFRALDLECT